MTGPDFMEGAETPHAIAGAWFARQRSGEMTPQDREDLRAWTLADPANRAAYVSVRRAWAGAAQLRGDPQVLAIRDRWTRRRWAPRAVAATLALALVTAAGGATWWQVVRPKPLVDTAFRTAVGERKVVRLPDGSELTLNTDTVVRTRADDERRLVFLERGQAYFQVAKDKSHPFVVTAGGRTVTALGTAFDVRVDGPRFEVTLVEGKVRVETPLPQSPGGPKAVSVQATEMVAGSRLLASSDAPVRVSPANVVVETSWTKDILIFDDEPLSAVLAEINRYSTKKIVLADSGLAGTPISGTFRTGDVDSFVRTLEAYRLARAGEDTADAVQLQAFAGADEKIRR